MGLMDDITEYANGLKLGQQKKFWKAYEEGRVEHQLGGRDALARAKGFIDTESLWLHPRTKQTTVRLSRWDDYPHFAEAMREHGPLPVQVSVRWGSLKPWTKFLIESDDEQHGYEIEAFIDDVAELIRTGADVPPLVALDGKPYDGRHRAFAAESLKITKAPIIDLV